jgi:hypothetical protein
MMCNICWLKLVPNPPTSLPTAAARSPQWTTSCVTRNRSGPSFFTSRLSSAISIPSVLVGPDMPTIYREQDVQAALSTFKDMTGLDGPLRAADPSPDMLLPMNRMSNNLAYSFLHLMPAISPTPDLRRVRGLETWARSKERSSSAERHKSPPVGFRVAVPSLKDSWIRSWASPWTVEFSCFGGTSRYMD